MSRRIIIFILFIFQVKNCCPDDCDLTQTPAQEGNVGQAGTFPWLGVIRVHLHEGAKLRIALTGSILVKATHALAIADDVAKIPKRIFQYDSKAMFIPNGGQPWLCQLKDYLLHPEYEYATYNTIAIIELEAEEGNRIPMAPICWPSYLYNASNQLYVLGYTDEKQLLEKVIHRVQYVDKTLCGKYYNKAGLMDHRYTPTHYQCCLAGNNTKDCDWDNGMVLASNSTGTWVLIGFGIRGPGCSAPSRFIEIFQYLPWINISTSNLQYPGYTYGKSAFGIGFKRQIMQTETKQRIKDIPIHQFFRSGNDPDAPENENEIRSVGPPPKWFDSMHDDLNWKEYNIEQIDKDTIVVSKFRNQYEKENGDCSNEFKRLCYTETAKIYAYPQVKGIASFKLSLMDLSVHDYTCVTIRIESEANSETQLWYDVSMDVDEPLVNADRNPYQAKFDRTPVSLLKKYPLPADPSLKKKKEPYENLEPRFVIDRKKLWIDQPNVNLFVQLKFINEAFLKLQVWGPAATSTSTTEEPGSSTSNTTEFPESSTSTFAKRTFRTVKTFTLATSTTTKPRTKPTTKPTANSTAKPTTKPTTKPPVLIIGPIPERFGEYLPELLVMPIPRIPILGIPIPGLSRFNYTPTTIPPPPNETHLVLENLKIQNTRSNGVMHMNYLCIIVAIYIFV